MATGTPIVGNNVEIYVAANTPANSDPPVEGTYEQVSDLTTISKNSTRDKTDTGVFMRSVKYTTYGARAVSYSLNGLLSVGDSGQDILRAAEVSNDIVFLKILWDSTNGFSVPCRVGSHTGNATPDGRVEVTYELAAEDDETEIGTGPNW